MEVNFLDILHEIERMRESWKKHGLDDGVLAADVIIKALKEKFGKQVLEAVLKERKS